MLLSNGNFYTSEAAMSAGMKACDIVREKLNGVAILGVEFECDPDKVGELINICSPVVSCLMHNIEGVHLYKVDTTSGTIKLQPHH